MYSVLDQFVKSACIMDTSLAQAAVDWTFEQTEKLECCREFARTLTNFLGINDSTACLAELWLAVTKAQCRMRGLTGEDVDLQSMGYCHAPPRPMEDIQKMNPYMLESLKIQIAVVKEMVPLFTALDERLGSSVGNLCEQVSTLL